MDIDDYIEELNDRYIAIENLKDEKPFFVNIAHYVHFVLEKPEIKRLTNKLGEILQKRLEASKQLTQVPKSKLLSKEEYKRLSPKEQEETDRQLQEELKKLIAADTEHKYMIAEIETSVDTAWNRLFWLHSFIFKRKELEQYYIKEINKSSYQEFKIEERELDRILLTTEQKLNRDDLVKINAKTGEITENKQREYFDIKDYLTYLTLLHNFLISGLKKIKTKDPTSIFPEDLLLVIYNQASKDGRLKIANKIVGELIKTGKVDNFLLAKLLNRNLSRQMYLENISNKAIRNSQLSYHQQLKNVFRTINRYWEKFGYAVSLKEKDNVSIIKKLKH